MRKILALAPVVLCAHVAANAPFIDVFLQGRLASTHASAEASRDGRSVWLHLSPVSYRIHYPATQPFTSVDGNSPALTFECRTGNATGVAPAQSLRTTLRMPMSPEQDDVPGVYSLVYWWKWITATAVPKHRAAVSVGHTRYNSILSTPAVDYSFPRPDRTIPLQSLPLLEQVAEANPVEISFASDGGTAEFRFVPDPEGITTDIANRMIQVCPRRALAQ